MAQAIASVSPVLDSLCLTMCAPYVHDHANCPSAHTTLMSPSQRRYLRAKAERQRLWKPSVRATSCDNDGDSDSSKLFTTPVTKKADCFDSTPEKSTPPGLDGVKSHYKTSATSNVSVPTLASNLALDTYVPSRRECRTKVNAETLPFVRNEVVLPDRQTSL